MKKWFIVSLVLVLALSLCMPAMAKGKKDGNKKPERAGKMMKPDTDSIVKKLAEELKLTSFQAEAIKDVMEKHHKQMAEMHKKFGEMRESFMKDISRELTDEQKEKLGPALQKARMETFKQNFAGKGPGQFSPLKMFKHIIKELQITDQQQAQIKQLVKEKINFAIDNWEKWADLEPEALQKQMQEMKDEFKASLEKILTKEQVEKIEAMKKMFMGGKGFGPMPGGPRPMAGNGPRPGDKEGMRGGPRQMMCDKLGLTDDQKEKMKAIHEKYGKELKAIHEKMRNEIQNDVLTAEQRAKCEEMKKNFEQEGKGRGKGRGGREHRKEHKDKE